jgi:hypothetical protein
MKNFQKIMVVTFIWLSALFLISCGSNALDSAENKLSTSISANTKSADFGKPASFEQITAMREKISTYFNGQNANNPNALNGEQSTTYGEKAIAAQIASTSVAKSVFRFYNSNSGTHFYTMSVVERDYIIQNFPFFSYEGVKFSAYPNTDPALSPVYRFYNKITGTHFYTINPAEKDFVIATWPEIFNFEGVAWHASTVEATDWIPIFRFYNRQTGTHFYTASAAEKDYIIKTWNWFTFEGIAYFVTPAPPACTAAVNGTTGYSLVFKGCDINNVAEYYDKTECVRENATGLIWEGKSTSGLRRSTRFFNNFDDTTKLQGYTQSSTGSPATNDLIIIYTPSRPSQSQIDSYYDVPSDSFSSGWGSKSGNSIGYANAVKASGLCGFTDWRRPAASELMSLVKPGSSPSIDTEWFSNTVANKYWTDTVSSSPSGVNSDALAVTVNFSSGTFVPYSRQTSAEGYVNERVYLRLVR